MKIIELSDAELRRALAATERSFGPYSYGARVMRRELVRRRNTGKRARGRKGADNGR